jgi:hypothetical protein
MCGATKQAGEISKRFKAAKMQQSGREAWCCTAFVAFMQGFQKR